MDKPMFRTVGVLAAAAIFCAGYVKDSCGQSPSAVSPFTDSRDGKTYKSVAIGSQTWMAENLNYEVDGSKCYNDDPAYCVKYGRLYTWSMAKGVCPAGWRLPSDAEWATLMDNVGGSPTAGKKFKSKTGWYNNGNGTNEYGFSALPGGDGYSNGGFYDAGGNGYWWSSTQRNAGRAWYRSMRCDYEGMGRGYDVKTALFSVRCLQD